MSHDVDFSMCQSVSVSLRCIRWDAHMNKQYLRFAVVAGVSLFSFATGVVCHIEGAKNGKAK